LLHQGLRSKILPTKKRAGKSEVDLLAIKNWINELNTEPCFVIEEPLHHAKSSQAVRSMALNFGKLLGACELRMWEVHAISVREWQIVTVACRSSSISAIGLPTIVDLPTTTAFFALKSTYKLIK